MNYMENAIAPIGDAYREKIIQHTWGHLAPIKNTTYKCKILFMVGEFESGTPKLIQTNFGELDSSPWLYDFLVDYMFEYTLNKNISAGVYLIDGSFRNYRLYGRPKLVYSL